MAVIKHLMAGLTSAEIEDAEDTASGRDDVVLFQPDGERVMGPFHSEAVTRARRSWEKESLLEKKKRGELNTQIRASGLGAEWDKFVVSFSDSDMTNLTDEQRAEYARIVIETLAAGDSNGFSGTKLYYVHEVHKDTRHEHFHFSIHRFAVDMSGPKPYVHTTIDFGKNSNLTGAADKAKEALQAAGFKSFDNFYNPNNTSIYSDMRVPDDAKESAAKRLEAAGVVEIPRALQTGAPVQLQVAPDELYQRLRARDENREALQRAEQVKIAEMTELEQQLKRVAEEVAAINAAKVAHQDKLDALNLRDAAVAAQKKAEQDAAAAAEAQADAEAKQASAEAQRADAVAAQQAAEASKQQTEAALEAEQEAHTQTKLSLAAAEQMIEERDAELKQRSEEYDSLAEELDAERTTTATQIEQIDALQAQLAAAQQQAAEAEKQLQHERGAREAEAKAAQDALSALRREREADAKRADERIAKADERIAKLEDRNVELAEKNASLAEKNTAFAEKIAEMKQGEREMIQAMKSAHAQIQTMKQQLEASALEIESQKEHIEKAVEAVNERDQSIARLRQLLEAYGIDPDAEDAGDHDGGGKPQSKGPTGPK